MEDDTKNGGVKHDQEKVRVELVSTVWTTAVAKVLTYGAKKYAPWNWAKGMAWSRLYGSVRRHMDDWYEGNDFDPDGTGLENLAQASCGLMFLYVYQRFGLGTDDRPRFNGAPAPTESDMETNTTTTYREG